MNKDIKQKWVDALRSDEFKQARGRLRTVDDRFCCLGVLCQIVHPTDWLAIQDCGDKWSHDGTVSLPSREILGLSGLHEADANTLAEMNDGGAGFSRIADYIEVNL